MLPKIHKILYPTDLSDSAKQAFGYAASLADRYHATITILHVVEDLSQNTAMLISSLLGEERWQQIREKSNEEFTGMIREQIQQFCRDMEKEYSGSSFTVDQIHVRQGQPTESIIAENRASDYDLLVMGTHGQGGITDVVMGSTARRVSRRSTVPVLVVRLPE